MKYVSIVLLVLFLAAGVAFNAGNHAYVGAKKCKMCHQKDKGGLIYENWAAGPHAKAFAVLGEAAAQATYTKLGKTGNPQEDPACLKCHVTAFGADTSLTASVALEEGVTCESCHGAGGDYWKKKIMMDRDQSIANGMIAAPKEQCVTCHNDGSPTFKEFKIEEHWAKIAHARPAGDTE